MEQKATKTAYLPEFGRTFEVPADWDGTKINYFARQKMNNLSVEETIGMQPLAPKTKYLNYTPLASNENVLYDLNLKKQGEETGFLTTTGKSAWNEFVDLTLGVASEGANVIAQNVTERHLNKTQASKERREEVTKRLLDAQKQSREWVDEYKFDINPYESKLAQGLGSIGVTYASMGAGVLAKAFKGKTIAEAVREGMPLIALFGLSSGGNMFYDVRQEGGSLLEANIRALSAGLLEAGLERLGLEGIVRGLRSKYVGSYILAPALTGSAQETAQSAKDTLIKGKYDKRSEEEKLNELIDSALLGAIGGAIEFGVARVVANKGIKKVEQTLEKGGVDKKTARNVAYTQMLPKEEAIKVREEIRLQGVKAGYDEETSQNIAEAVTQSPEQVLNDVIDIMNREEPYEISEELREELKNTYIEATSVANEDADKYILMKDEIKSLIEKAGKDEQEADETARMMTSIAINSYQIAKEQGVDVDFDKIKNEVFKLNNIINYAQNEPISEAEQEDIWREVERERVAELQEGIDRYMEESQGGVLYSENEEENGKLYSRTLSVPQLYKYKGKLVSQIKKDRDIIEDAVYAFDSGKTWAEYEQDVSEALNKITISLADVKIGENVAKEKLSMEDIAEVDEKVYSHKGEIEGDSYVQELSKVGGDKYEYASNKLSRIEYEMMIDAYKRTLNNKIDFGSFEKVNRSLSGKLYSQTEGGEKVDINTPEFKAWSKNSEVVEFDKVDDYSFTENPITIEMEHGTNRGGFTEFDEGMIGTNSMASSGFFFGSRNISRTYSKNRAEIRKEDIDWWKSNHSEDENRELSGVYRVYVHFDNPAVYDFKGASWNGVAYGQYAIYNEDDYGYETDEFGDYLLFDSYAKAENYLESKNIYDYKDGRSISDRSRETKYSILSDPEIFLSTNELAEEAKQNGFDGVIFENIDDSGSYNQAFAYNGTVAVAFNPNQIKSVYNQGTFNPETNDIFNSQTEGDILGSYDIAKREVELFKGHNPSTLTHELGHHFIISHLNFMESIGANDKNKPVFEFLSGLANREINSVRDMERADHENLVEAFIDYMNIGQAPNIVTGNIFQRAKKWLINEYNIHKTTASKEIREYFDTLISREGAIPDVSKIQDRIGEFKEILRQAQKGEQVSFNGMGIKEVKDLKKAINTTIRRKGLSLRDELIKAGGIKEGTELAKSLGFDVLKKDKMFTTKEHAIQTEGELIDWLAEKGYITPVQEGESYSDTEARWSEVENLIYDAERVYRPEEQRLNEEREASLVNQAKAQEIVDDILKDNKLGLKGVNDLYDLLQKISSRKDDVDIIKINKGAIKYLETRLNDLQRDYNDIIKQKDIEARKIGEELVKVNEERRNLKEEKKVSKKIRELAQKQYLEFVRNQHLSGDYKVKILNKVKDINSFSDLVRVVRQATPQIQRIIEMEMKHLQKRNIDIVLKRSKPKKRTKQISTYTYNKLFEELRAINKMTKENATAALNDIRNKLGEMDKNGEIAEPTFAEIIRNKMLSYKSLGMDSSVELMNDLHNELLSLYAEAVNAGIDAKIEKFERRQNAINEVVDYIDTHEASKNFISRLLGKSKKSDDLYIKNTNFYGITNALFGKKWADKNEMVTVLNKVNIDTYKRREKAYKEAEKIYKVKDRGDLNTLLAQKENTDDYILRGNDGSVDELSIMEIMDLYLGMKNEQTRRQLLKNYEEFDEDGTQITTQIDDLIENLTDEDIEFANYLIKDLDKNYKELNKLYIKMYGIDMPKVENYFPRKSDRQDSFYDMESAKYIAPASAVASQMKDRASGVKPIVKSALSKYLENISDYYYMVDAFEKFKDIYDVVSSKQVRGAIKGKYSNGVTMALVDSIRAMSLRGQQVHLLSDIENSANRWVSNIIGSKIALNTSVFIKQLISITNYSENMPVKDFSKNLIEGLLNLRETVEFMNKFDGDFFETRMNAGLQSEAVARMIKEGEDLKNTWISAGDKYKWTKLMGSFVKWGDIIPIYIGGYARVKYLLDNGATLEEARQKFELETLQSQQDANAASLAKYQRNKNPAARLFSAFLNAPAQYMRKMYDADIQYRRKEITAEQFRKTVLNYGVIQPALYIMVSNMLKGLWDGNDDEAKFYHGLATQIVTSPLQGIPIAGSLLQNAGYFLEKKYRGESTNYDVIGVLFIDDVNRSHRKMGKKDKDIVDLIDIVSPFIEPFVIAPTNAIKQVTKAVETRID